MKIHRFIGDFNTSVSKLTLTTKELVHQIGAVLKLSKGEKIILSKGNGTEMLCEIALVSKSTVELENCTRQINENEPSRSVVLCLALLKKDNFELALQKAVEVGASEIVPLNSERTVKQGFVRPRLEKIMKEAAEQSGRGVVAHLEEPLSVQDALFRANRMGTVVFCDGVEANLTPSRVKAKGAVYVFVGPEGGWSDAEREMAREIDAQFISLAPTTLRAETAATIATYLFASYS